MAWTYYPDLSQDRDQVRFLIHDTTSTQPQFADEEIDWMLTQEANIYMTAAALSDILVTRSGNTKRKQIGKLSIEYDASFYRGLSTNLRARGMCYQIPYAGGISIADKAAVKADSDWVQPAFNRGQGESPGAPKPSVGVTNPLTDL